jgi:hypothetical protein
METRGSDKVLVDTSVWIDFFRKREPFYTIVRQLIDEDRVCCLDMILAELIQGARSERKVDVLKDFLQAFDFIHVHSGLWEQAGMLSYHMRKKGRPLGLADCFIAIVAYSNKIELLTLDKHFKYIKGEIGLRLYPVKGR